MLGTEQLSLGQDITWSEMEYQGSALMDAYIAFHIATNNSNWGELGQMFMGQIADWSINKDDFQWSDTKSDDGEGSPYLGCNNDRMTHVPKGVIGIRMDGVENVVFKNLEIYDLHEKAELGSEVCGEYWDVSPLAFTGTGHFLQNSPYFYGYTGNRAHGIMSDWSEYTLAGDVSIHDLKSDTGLIRGIGVYTSTQLTFDDDTSLSFADFSAGHELYETDTDAMDHPYAPSVAKPMHIVWAHYDSTAMDTFYAKINGAPTVTSATCILGRDGTNSSDWTISVDNEGCTQQTVNVMAASAHSVHSVHSNKNVQWMTVTLVVVAVLLAIWHRLSGHKKVVSDTEVQPLLQSA